MDRGEVAGPDHDVGVAAALDQGGGSVEVAVQVAEGEQPHPAGTSPPSTSSSRTRNRPTSSSSISSRLIDACPIESLPIATRPDRDGADRQRRDRHRRGHRRPEGGGPSGDARPDLEPHPVDAGKPLAQSARPL